MTTMVRAGVIGAGALIAGILALWALMIESPLGQVKTAGAGFSVVMVAAFLIALIALVQLGLELSGRGDRIRTGWRILALITVATAVTFGVLMGRHWFETRSANSGALGVGIIAVVTLTAVCLLGAVVAGRAADLAPEAVGKAFLGGALVTALSVGAAFGIGSVITNPWSPVNAVDDADVAPSSVIKDYEVEDSGDFDALKPVRIELGAGETVTPLYGSFVVSSRDRVTGYEVLREGQGTRQTWTLDLSGFPGDEAVTIGTSDDSRSDVPTNVHINRADLTAVIGMVDEVQLRDGDKSYRYDVVGMQFDDPTTPAAGVSGPGFVDIDCADTSVGNACRVTKVD